MKCPKCGHTRTFGETAPEWQCPSCGVAYAKASAGADGNARAQQRREPGGGGKFIAFLIVFVAASLAWALIPGLRTGPDKTDFSQSQVVMYSLTTCGYCNIKRAELHEKGVPFVEYFVDADPARNEELFKKLRAAGHLGAIGTPTFEVNGRMLPNNPSLTTIIKHL